MRRWWIGILFAGSACAGASTQGAPTSSTPSPTPSPTVRAVSASVFTACPRTPAVAGKSHLKTGPVAKGELTEEDGELRPEDGGDLVLPSGTVTTGNGYEAATASASRTVRLSDRATTGRVTMGVFVGASGDRRIAYVELSVPGGAPVTWTETDAAISTDGGDGGFSTPESASTVVDIVDDYVEAFFPSKDSASGNVCVHRTTKGKVDSVLFAVGYGDGTYPVFLGTDGSGKPVSLVVYCDIVRGRAAAYPGSPRCRAISATSCARSSSCSGPSVVAS